MKRLKNLLHGLFILTVGGSIITALMYAATNTAEQEVTRQKIYHNNAICGTKVSYNRENHVPDFQITELPVTYDTMHDLKTYTFFKKVKHVGMCPLGPGKSVYSVVFLDENNQVLEPPGPMESFLSIF